MRGMDNIVIVDTLLRLVGSDPGQYGRSDKWPSFFALLFIYSFPIVLILLFFIPFFYIWRKKKRWTIRNVIIGLLISTLLVAAGVGTYYFIFILVAGLGVRQYYSGGLLY